jgi:hypothetical protein
VIQQPVSEQAIEAALAALGVIWEKDEEACKVLQESLDEWLLREAVAWTATLTPHTVVPVLEGRLYDEWANARYNAAMGRLTEACEKRDDPQARFWLGVIECGFPSQTAITRVLYRANFSQVWVKVLP